MTLLSPLSNLWLLAGVVVLLISSVDILLMFLTAASEPRPAFEALLDEYRETLP